MSLLPRQEDGKSSSVTVLQVVARLLLTIPLSGLLVLVAFVFLIENESRHALSTVRALLLSATLVALSGLCGNLYLFLVGMMMVGFVFVVAPYFPPVVTDIVFVVDTMGCTAAAWWADQQSIAVVPLFSGTPPFCCDGGRGGGGGDGGGDGGSERGDVEPLDGSGSGSTDGSNRNSTVRDDYDYHHDDHECLIRASSRANNT